MPSTARRRERGQRFSSVTAPSSGAGYGSHTTDMQPDDDATFSARLNRLVTLNLTHIRHRCLQKPPHPLYTSARSQKS
ncbi:hypothetical protein ebA1424 [Aromatoleum aromaticum EbN1]|uniref:Uncharacterized protein n=1 Tax=Aromatoleum aromaticum (strain DSM 19018 / LMG 30748 / EbN1) TaxID=76114 RepID=Q5P712_AROAE|nr:hypothetical protein ebA1424 [Aromatoleum aromaticum EbN1]